MNKAPSSLFINLTFYFMVMMQLARCRMRLSAVCRSASCLEFSTGAKYEATACISHAASRRGDHSKPWSQRKAHRAWRWSQRSQPATSNKQPQNQNHIYSNPLCSGHPTGIAKQENYLPWLSLKAPRSFPFELLLPPCFSYSYYYYATECHFWGFERKHV